ncbi:HNH endonuclease signature motif containing protein [Amnibacterium endophyticum]|uniref:HNH endonuclease signature motif containing protein n=1 Tax=Amnibacterium endophyticum TaxID=2109337 RepID=A0ABW4LDZ1_9MICO
MGPTARDLLLEGIKQAASGEWAGLAVPGRKGVVPQVFLTIPLLSALGRTTEHAQLRGHGLMDVETAKDLAGRATSFVRVLTDPCTGVRLDMDRATRMPPEDMRRWVQVRDEVCRFPGCNRPAHLCDVDHAHEWQHGGVTGERNLLCACRADHLAKSEELFGNELRSTGAVRWCTPWRRTFDDPPIAPLAPAPESLRPPDDDPCPF